jgi:hypothetical protein
LQIRSAQQHVLLCADAITWPACCAQQVVEVPEFVRSWAVHVRCCFRFVACRHVQMCACCAQPLLQSSSVGVCQTKGCAHVLLLLVFGMHTCATLMHACPAQLVGECQNLLGDGACTHVAALGYAYMCKCVPVRCSRSLQCRSSSNHVTSWRYAGM